MTVSLKIVGQNFHNLGFLKDKDSIGGKSFFEIQLQIIVKAADCAKIT